MNSSFKERLARLGPVQAVPQVVSGSPVAVSLRPVELARFAARGWPGLGGPALSDGTIREGQAGVVK